MINLTFIFFNILFPVVSKLVYKGIPNIDSDVVHGFHGGIETTSDIRCREISNTTENCTQHYRDPVLERWSGNDLDVQKVNLPYYSRFVNLR